MDKIIIKGNGPLRGETYASGAKNAALPILCSSLLSEGEHIYSNVPKLADVATTVKLLRTMGCEAEQLEGNQVKVRVGGVLTPEAPYDLVKTMRASVLVLGPLLARCGRARVSMPGGCAIGARPIDQHLKGLKALGAEIELAEGYVEARAQKLRGAVIAFDVITVTGTENIMMAAVLAEGRTVLENAAREPEVEDLALALNQMGAQIQGAGTDTIVIDGVSSLKPARHTVIADRIEVGTLLVAAAITAGDVRVTRTVPAHIEPVLQKLREAGCVITTETDTIHLKGPTRPQPINIKTQEHPGFPTDMQAQLMALMTVAEGTSVISEHIFENRFMHVAEMRRMGADISVEGPTAIVKGRPQLSGAPVMATDLRASASLILAGLRADGKTELSRVYHLDRGYEHLELKLNALGAKIERINE